MSARWVSHQSKPSCLPKNIHYIGCWFVDNLNIALRRRCMRREPHPGSSMVIVVMNCVVSLQEGISNEPVIILIVINNGKETGVGFCCVIFLHYVVVLDPVVIHRNLEFVVVDPQVESLVLIFLRAGGKHDA